jgi:polyhydroxyalkanoate synthesis regulator phasin
MPWIPVFSQSSLAGFLSGKHAVSFSLKTFGNAVLRVALCPIGCYLDVIFCWVCDIHCFCSGDSNDELRVPRFRNGTKGAEQMLDLLKKGFLAGIGAIVLTTEKVQEVARRMVEEGKMSTEEAEKMAEELIQSGEHQWDEINNRISEALKKWTDSEQVVKREEFEELKARIEILDRRILMLEGGSPMGDEGA